MANKRSRLRLYVLLALIALLAAGCRESKPTPAPEAEAEPWALRPYVDDRVLTAHFHQGDYYFIGGDYRGAYDVQYCEGPNGSLAALNGEHIFSFDEYSDFCRQWNLEQTFSDPARQYLVLGFAVDSANVMEARLAEAAVEDGTAKLYYWNTEAFDGSGTGAKGYAMIVPTDQKVTSLQTEPLFSMDVYKSLARAEEAYAQTGYEAEPEQTDGSGAQS